MGEEESRGRDTRERLLDAAGEIFAQRGFRAATVREISRRAGANVAAVNYYFGDKERLYAAVVKYTFSKAVEKYPPTLGLENSSSPVERLKAFIRSFLFRILDEGRPAWHGQLMMQEVAQPTAALDQLVDEAIRPLSNRLMGIVRDLLGADSNDEKVRLCTMSIIGQCVYFGHARSVITRLFSQTFGPVEIEHLADHVTCFSFAAMKGISSTGNPVSMG
ncbi:MAG: CerR family C-terminal domain-containing protein [Syntrophobacteraceae bacterium]|nr:CerR family C-terminal domain-containing protein [Syntrophobacteraceae bacterium]